MARTKKLTDPIYSPTNPTSEAAIRAQIDDSIQEVYDKSSKATDTVNLTGNQTIADVKTFSSSPIVPTPTTSTQVANKAYVDGVAISATIPLDSLTDEYLASAPGNIKPRVAILETDVIANTKGTSDYFTTTGTQPNYAVTTGKSYSSLPDGFKITVKPHANSVGTTTLSVDSVLNIPCQTQDGDVVEFKLGIPQSLRFNGTNFIQPSSGGLKRTGDQVATASSVSGTTLKLTPPKGYYDGSTGTVNITDADFIAENIKSGINLFGKIGTLPDGTGKRSVSVGTGNTTGTDGTVTVTGLGFTPSAVIVNVNFSTINARLSYSDATGAGTPTGLNFAGYRRDSGGTFTLINNGTEFTVTSGGFTCKFGSVIGSGTPYNYIAVAGS